MMTVPAPRTLYISGFLLCTGLFAAALYFQHVLGMEPCPLCIFQRIGVILLGSIFLLAAIINPGRGLQRLFGLLFLLTATASAGVSARHVWLQSLPEDQVPACGPGLEFMFDVFPLDEAISMVFRGSGECAEVSWRFLGLSMPGWMLLIFTLFALFGLWQLINPRTPTVKQARTARY